MAVPITNWLRRWSHVVLGAAYAPSMVLLPLCAPEILWVVTRPIRRYGFFAPTLAAYAVLSYVGVAVALLLLFRERRSTGEPLTRAGRVTRWALLANWLPHGFATCVLSLLSAIAKYGLVD